jgi:threonylcarbamoyladenosine tRNA methylthiotransferase MtaB
MTLLRVAFRTLGCKLNQLETESIADAFAGAGARIISFDEAADLCVVNTCTVTGKAEQKARRVIRQALAQNPQAVVLVTGCYAQMDPEGLSLVHPRSVVLPGEEKAELLRLAAWLHENWQGHGDLFDAVVVCKHGLAARGSACDDASRHVGSGIDPAVPDRFSYHPKTFAFHSRPSLKIQDGCDNRCAYCRVCLARGSSVSLGHEELLSRVRDLENSGKAEVVLTGINLSQYRDGVMRFPGLLAYLAENTGSIRFRLSSYEPERIDDAFLSAFAHPRVQPHVHLAVQSGSSSVLRRMARPYDAERVRAAVASLRAVKDDPFIAVDMIAGFPGETDEEFEETHALCRDLDFAWIHAFPFSARPGTKAFDMRPKVPERIAGERTARLSELARAGKTAYVKRWAGKTVGVILEKNGNLEADDEASPLGMTPGSDQATAKGRIGTSSNYLKIWIEEVPESLRPGTWVRAAIVGLPNAGKTEADGADAEGIFAGA